VLAISEVDVYENSSSLFDEYIAHRLGMIPLLTDPKDYKIGEDYSKHSATFTLNVQGPKTVYSGDLMGKDKKMKPAYDNIPIIKLIKGEELKFESKATLGLGKTHAKYQAGLAFYKKNGNDFDFQIESYGNMKPKEMLDIALEVLKNKTLQEIKKK